MKGYSLSRDQVGLSLDIRQRCWLRVLNVDIEAEYPLPTDHTVARRSNNLIVPLFVLNNQ